WDATTGQALSPPLLHGSDVTAVALSSDGKTALTAGADPTAGTDQKVQLWELPAGKPGKVFLSVPEAVRWGPFCSDHRRAVMVSPERAQVWDLVTGRPLGAPITLPGWVQAAAFRLDGDQLLTGSYDRTVRLWDITTGRALRSPLSYTGRPTALACS